MNNKSKFINEDGTIKGGMSKEDKKDFLKMIRILNPDTGITAKKE
jgi:hypothetical protein